MDPGAAPAPSAPDAPAAPPPENPSSASEGSAPVAPAAPAAPGTPSASAAPPTAPAPPHESILRRLRRAGGDPRPFRRRLPLWAVVGLGLLVFCALAPLLMPQARATTERLVPLLSLIFLLAAVGLWLGLGNRALAIAVVLTFCLYALTAWTRLAFELHDLYVLALLVGFLIYALAGFNLVFVLEEAVYDAHRLLHLRHRLWRVVPFAAVATLAVGLPLAAGGGGILLPSVWAMSVLGTLLLGGWWFMRLFHAAGEGLVLRELHLFVAGALAAGALVDAVRLLADRGVATSIVAYLAILGTWLYVSYTTLQRTHFLLRGRNAQPWFAILLAASFAVLGHAQLLFEVGGASGLRSLLDQRIAYVVAGLWIGIAFFVARSLWRLFRFLRDDRRLGARARIAFGRLARLTEAFFATEQRIGRAALRIYREVDEALPGHHGTEWELDNEGGPVRRVTTRRR